MNRIYLLADPRKPQTTERETTSSRNHFGGMITKSIKIWFWNEDFPLNRKTFGQNFSYKNHVVPPPLNGGFISQDRSGALAAARERRKRKCFGSRAGRTLGRLI